MARFSHPEFFAVAGAVAGAAMARPDFPVEYEDQFRWGGAEALTEVGRLHAAFSLLEQVQDPNRRFCGAGGRVTVAGVLPIREYESVFAREAVFESLDGAGDGPQADISRVSGLACARFAARVVGRDADAEFWAATADSIVESLPEDAQERAGDILVTVDGIGDLMLAFMEGDPETALRLFEASPVSGQLSKDFRRFRARLLIALDRSEEALETLGPLGTDPVAEFDRARAFEALGRDAEARAAYEYFLRYWTPDLPELEARADSATAGLTRIAARLN